MTDTGRGRIYLSPPDVGARERALLLDAFDSGWIAPVGPDLDAFEAELGARTGTHAVAVASGTAALHLALHVSGVGPGDQVLVSSFTFVASANAVLYTGATPVFVDADDATWTIDPELVVDELERAARRGRPPRALVAVDLYGQCADYDRLVAASRSYGVLVVEDAAEALGATYRGRPAGSLGDIGVLSFNGNKTITTSTGGAVLCHDPDQAARVRYLAAQARQPVLHYEHVELGFNYRLSNLLAALGRGQLVNLDARVARRRDHKAWYRELLSGIEGVELMPDAPYGRASNWLSCLTVDPSHAGFFASDVIAALAADDIEARPTWKPMHLQPQFAGHRSVGGAVSTRLFERGVCLPSGSAMTEDDLARIAAAFAPLVNR